MFPRPQQIVVLDLRLAAVRSVRHRRRAVRGVVADGCRLPFRDQSISMAVCNSAIEHVSCPRDLAREIRRVSASAFVQTPNASFPFEMHSFVPIPLYNRIPWRKVQRVVSRLFGADYGYLCGVRYLSEPELRMLFPEATVTCEKWLGMGKSFYVSWTRPQGA